MAATTPDPNAPGPAIPGNNGFPPNLTQENDISNINISPLTPPAQKTLVYAPDAQILIAHGNKQYDVSKDIVSVAVERNENAVSTLVFKLANKRESKKPRYNLLFERMDRVTCRLKRTDWVQVFAGYLDSVPYVQLYPGTVNFRASCTLKRCLHTWWDPGLPASRAIFDQMAAHQNETKDGEYSMDSGSGSLLRNFLVKVGGWDPQHVHVQQFPNTYFLFLQKQLEDAKGTTDQANEFRRLLLGDDITGGRGNVAGAQLGVSSGSYPTGFEDRKREVIKAVDDFGLGPDTQSINSGQALGDAASQGRDHKDANAWEGTQKAGSNLEEAGKKSDAAVHCFMTIAVESSWHEYANPSVPGSLDVPGNDGYRPGGGGDHDSVGLYQQRQAGWGTLEQRMNPRASTQMFLQKLNGFDWRNMERGAACQKVQVSGFPERYAVFEQAAEQEVRSLRNNTAPGTGANGLPTQQVPVINQPLPSGTPGAVDKATATAVSAASESTSLNGAGNITREAAVAAGRPAFDSQGAILYGTSQLGKPYVYGAPGPATYDCSSFTQWCYRSIGIDIGRDTIAQAHSGTPIAMASLQPGDLIQPHSDHVVMYLGPGLMMHAPHTGDVVRTAPIPPQYMTSGQAYHYDPAQYGGPGPAFFNPQPSGPGMPPGTGAQGANGSVTATGSTEQIARNLFTWMFQQGDFMDDTSMLYGATPGTTEKAFLNDQSMIHMVISMATAGMRKFCSAPNGDFVAYYPDYFGMDQKRAVLKLEDIEMKNVQIDLNDDALATHVYAAGSQTPINTQMLGWLQSKGYATVENEWLFQRMQMAAPHVKGETLTSGKEIMKRFGVRPMINNMAMVQSGPMEVLMAIAIFMEQWALQYATQIELTFMPELFPGMRIELVGHDLSVYVSQVTHNCDFENGFTTSATIMAPSNTDFGKIFSDWADAVNGNGKSRSSVDLNDFLSGAATWLY